MRILPVLLLFCISLFSQNKRKGFKVQSSENNTKRWALVVGINDYTDVSITKLSKARNDAKKFADILRRKGEFNEVLLLVDDNNPKKTFYPTKNNIEAKIDSIIEMAGSEDLIIFFFSGHGISDPEGSAYLLPVDAIAENSFKTGVSIEGMVQKMKKKKLKRTILIIDACRETVMVSKGLSKKNIEPERYQNSELGATFFSTRSGGYSYEDHETPNGVFTRYLIEGLEGAADENKDGIVSFMETEIFVSKKVRKWSLRYNKKQRPYIKYNQEKSGEISLTMSNPKFINNDKYEAPTIEKTTSNTPSNISNSTTSKKNLYFNGKTWRVFHKLLNWNHASQVCKVLKMRLPDKDEIITFYNSKKKLISCDSSCSFWSKSYNSDNAYHIIPESGLKNITTKMVRKNTLCVK